jgi:predicted CoA-binding protein
MSRLSNPDQSEQFQFDSIEQMRNTVLEMFRRVAMVRAVVEEAAALTSLALFLGMIAVWAQLIVTL